MSEPKTSAARTEEVLPGLLHWSVDDDRIGFRSDAYALDSSAGLVLIDPLPLAEPALLALGRPVAICLTIQSHQRSTWRYRRRFRALVYAPLWAEGLEEEPDHFYRHGERLPGGLRAIHAPGPCEASYALLDEGTGVLFLGDLLSGERASDLRFVPDAYQDAPRRTRASVRALLDEPFDAVCGGHAPPIPHGGRRAVRDALERDRAATHPLP